MNHAIKTIRSGSTSVLLAVIGMVLFTGAVQGSEPPSSAAAQAFEPVGFLIRTNYHGWTNSILVSNGRVEAVIVPAIGRVMQFRFAGEEGGPVWGNREMDGKAPNPESQGWGNFGGGKTWPAPQPGCPKVTPRASPPPPPFHSTPGRGK